MSRPYSVNIWTCKPYELPTRVGFRFRTFIDARNAAYLAIHTVDMGFGLHQLPARMRPGAAHEYKARAGYPIVHIERET